MATVYSPHAPGFAMKHIALAVVVLVCGLVCGRGADTNLLAWQHGEFLRAQKTYLADTNQPTNAWQFARACFDISDAATNEAQRADFARQGIAASKSAIARQPRSAAAHYYLAMNYGELAQAEAPSLTAYKLVHEVEREFKTAADLDEKFDFAGPARNLGQLYFQAPGWPLSIGSKKKAREWFERAAAIAPDYPENQINLADAHTHWRERAEAEKAFHAVQKIWLGVETNFPGIEWQGLRNEWRRRLGEANTAFRKTFKADP